MTSVGIDVGGTKCHGVAVDGTGRVVAEVRRATPDAADLAGLLAGMHAELGGGPTLGVGLPGLVTPEGVVLASPNLRGARHTPVGPDLRRILGIDVRVENDATAAAHAEWQVGAARGARDAVMVTLGTGIGGGIVTGGRLVRGAHGLAGEIGHMTVETDGIECPCGQRGCWERYASGSALGALGGGGSGEDVIARAVRGDDDALGSIEVFARWVATGLASLSNLLDPEVFVIGGGVVGGWDVIHPAVERWFGELLYASGHRPRPLVVPAVLGPGAGAIGCALLASAGG